MSLYTVPVLQVRNKTAIIYNEYVNTHQKYSITTTEESQASEPSEKVTQLKSYKRYQGIVTDGVRKRIKKAICLMLQSTENRTIYNPVTNRPQQFKISFITLTIPDSNVVEAKKAQKELLEPLLRWLRRSHTMKSYVWKVEQQERGQLHYHLMADCYVHYQELRNYWNRLLTKAELNSEYVAKKGHSDANSTDIHSLKKVKNVEAYLIKYLSKTEQNSNPINGKVWDCSKNLKAFNYYSTTADNYTMNSLMAAVERKEAFIKHADRYTMICVNKGHIYSYLPADKRDDFRVYMWNVRNYDESGTDLLSLNCTKTNTECPEKETQSVLYQIQVPQQPEQSSAPLKREKPVVKQLGFFD